MNTNRITYHIYSKSHTALSYDRRLNDPRPKANSLLIQMCEPSFGGRSVFDSSGTQSRLNKSPELFNGRCYIYENEFSSFGIKPS